MTDTQPDDLEGFATPGEGMYQRGQYDAYVKLSGILAQLMSEIPQPWRDAEKNPAPPMADDQSTDWPIESLGIKNHGTNILKRENINTVKELTRKSKDELMRYKGIGEATFDDIDKAVRRHGMTLHEP